MKEVQRQSKYLGSVITRWMQRIGVVTMMSGCNEEVNGADGVKYRNVIADAYYTIVVSVNVNSTIGLKTWRVQQRHVSRLWACGMMCLKKGGPYKAR